MKRILGLMVIIMSVVILLAACSSGNSNPPSNDDAIVENTQEDSLEGTEDTSENEIDISHRLSEAYIDLMKDGKYTMHYKVQMDFDGRSEEADIVVVISGDDKAIKISTGDFENITITKEDEIYMVNHETRTIMVMPLNMPMQTIEDEMADPSEIDAFSIEYIGNGKKEFMGNIRDYEEYATEDGRIFYYFDGKDLDGMEILYEDNSFIMDIQSMTDNVDESIFELPSGYETIRLGN